jgi:hypothetical protein
MDEQRERGKFLRVSMRILAILAVQSMGLWEYAVVASNQWCVSALFKLTFTERTARFFHACGPSNLLPSISCRSIAFL